MYKKIALTFVLAAMFVMLVGCNQAEKTLDRVENVVDSVEDTAGDAVKPKNKPDAALTREQAETIALEYASMTAEQVSRLRTEYEVDDGVPQYDVQFYDGAWEYKFEIHAETGQIISFDKDSDR